MSAFVNTIQTEDLEFEPEAQNHLANALAELRNLYEQIVLQKQSPVQRMHVPESSDAISMNYYMSIRIMCEIKQLLDGAVFLIDKFSGAQQTHRVLELIQKSRKALLIVPSFLLKDSARLTSDFGGLHEFNQDLAVKAADVEKLQIFAGTSDNDSPVEK